ncbi:MAG: hypothetical protein JRC66_00650 [Deltaproteobacteria bacterium]|nr:hypothetical protein [Deltaproteobacteria bacterium]
MISEGYKERIRKAVETYLEANEGKKERRKKRQKLNDIRNSGFDIAEAVSLRDAGEWQVYIGNQIGACGMQGQGRQKRSAQTVETCGTPAIPGSSRSTLKKLKGSKNHG